MATLEQETESRNRLKASLSELAKMNATNLARKDLGEDLNFEAGVVHFDRMLRLFRTLDEIDLEDIPFQTLEQLGSYANTVLNIFRSILRFSIKEFSNNPINQRDSLLNQAREQYDGVFANVAPTIAFGIRKSTDFARLEQQARATVAEMQALKESNEQTTKSILENAQRIIGDVRRIAEEAGVSQHAAYFRTEADRNASEAKPWLYWTIALASLTAVLSIGLSIRYYFVLPTLTPSQSIQLAIPKLFLFSLLLSATIWTGRTYRAYRHNAVVNRHRQNALSSFEAFAQAATSDQETKNAVLLQATQCIFSPQATGYIQAEAESTMPHVLEVVRSLGKSS